MLTAPIGKAEIAALIPHGDRMCLLDAVLAWDSGTITCRASSHRDRDHPLARDGRLDALCGLEYAAQAMAVHGGLIAASGQPPAGGYLASVRDVVCHAVRLDDIAEDLTVTAVLLTRAAARVIYDFKLSRGLHTILEGRAAVVIDVALVA